VKQGLAVTASLAACTLAACVILGASPVMASASNTSTSTSSALKSWYQHTGHPVLGRLLADEHRFTEITQSSKQSVIRQDCSRFELDVHNADHGKPPPQSTLALDYRYYLSSATKSFSECLTGYKEQDALNTVQGVRGGVLAVRAAASIIKGAGRGTAANVPPSSTNLVPALPASLVVSQCTADFKVLEVALDAYDAQENAYPAPPAPWGAATYSHDFGPLVSSKAGGPYMAQPLNPTYYGIEWDSSGHVWVEAPGHYDASYNPAQGSSTACAGLAS
jgi:hypothetical protein